jgi:UDP-2,4-diacetamido-2,4,6-trideoxy-beta-L-altropyranose hydrolase
LKTEPSPSVPPATVLFRVDANAQIGSGHLMRCLALAQAWQKSGERVAFATAQPIERLESEKMRTFAVTAAAGSAADCEQTCAFAAEVDAAWIVVDGYRFPADFQTGVKARGFRLMIIDDHGAAGRYAADLVLDQNPTAAAARYADRASSTRLLLGTRYTLLRAEFEAWRSWHRTFPGKIQRIIVTFGGADPVNATRKVLAGLASLEDVEVIAVLGAHFTGEVAESTNLRVLRDVRDMPALMAGCDLAITAAGSTCWELAFLQTPMLVMPIAENQMPIADALAASGAAVNLGWHAEVSPQDIADALAALVESETRRRTMGEAGRALIDGEGAARVLADLKKSLLQIRRATVADCRLIWEWSNQPSVRAASFLSEPIPWEDHCRWFHERLTGTATVLYVAERGLPIGQTRFELQEDDEALISISLDAAVRGRSYGSAVILASCERLFMETTARRVRALIKRDNGPSLRAFDRAGFQRVADTVSAGATAAQFVLEKEAA